MLHVVLNKFKIYLQGYLLLFIRLFYNAGWTDEVMWYRLTYSKMIMSCGSKGIWHETFLAYFKLLF
jgi:hypothetical protein